MSVARTASLLTFLVLAVTFIALEESRIGHNILIAEGGIAELLAAGCWFASGVGCLITAFRFRARRYDYLLLAYFTLALGARELDVHKNITEWNSTKLLNYFKPFIPLEERIAVFLLLVLPPLLTVPLAIRRWTPRIRRAWHSGESWPRDLLVWFVTLVVIVQADKLHLIAQAFGITIDDKYPFRVIEETLEAAFALFTFLVLLPRWRLLAQAPVARR